MRVVEVQRVEVALLVLAVVSIVSGCRATEVFTKKPPVTIESPAPGVTRPGMKNGPTGGVATVTKTAGAQPTGNPQRRVVPTAAKTAVRPAAS